MVVCTGRLRPVSLVVRGIANQDLISRFTPMEQLTELSVVDYHRLVEAGLLQDQSVELLAGKIVEMSPETPMHYSTAKRDAKYLEILLSGRAEVRFNGPITLSDSEPEPDIAIVRLPESAYNQRHPAPADIFWLIEVAQTSFKKDREVKAAIYATASIREYWVLNLKDQQLIVLRDPQNGLYRSEQIFSAGTVAPLAFLDVQVAVERMIGAF